MLSLIPFRGIRYNPGKTQFEKVVAPPYDVISPDLQARLYDRSPHNVVRLILGREEDRYQSAADHFRRWQEEQVLVRDKEPGFYMLHQTFDGEKGNPITRRGFIALCRLEEFDKKVVLPHEKTLSKPREDRLKLFKATNSNFSQIFSLYSDPEKRVDRAMNGIATSAPVADVVFDDVRNRLWRVTDPSVIKAVQDSMREKQVLIADGHHRYETALAYREFMKQRNSGHTGDEKYNYVMMFFTNVDDENLVIYPTHRTVHSLNSLEPGMVIKELEKHFIRREFKERHALLAALRSSSVPSFGLLIAGSPVASLLSLKPSLTARSLVQDSVPDEVKDLDVTLLHSVIFKGTLGISLEDQEQKKYLDYVREPSEVYEAVDNGKAQLAFLMNATKIQQVRSVAKAGHTMPQKSTFFFPKLLSGLVLHVMDE